MSATLDDIRYALRSMCGNPGFTAVALVSLALAIGVNTAIFSLVDQMLLWSVPAREPGRLVNLEGGRSGAYPVYREYRNRNHVFSEMLATSRPVAVGVRPEGAAAVEVGRVDYVSGSYFQTLGVGAAVGRVMVEADDVKPGGSPVAILAYDYWQRRFAGNLTVIGRKLAVNGYPLQIAGIAEAGFDGVFNGERVDAFVPLTMYPLTTPAAAPMWDTASMYWLSPMGRLRPGVSIETARADLRVLWPQVTAAVNDAAVKAGGKARQFSNDDQPRVTDGRRGVRSGRSVGTDPLVASMAAAGLVLLIACVNLSNLLLARAAGRGREIAIRQALGATRARLMRQILTESLVLAAIGAAAGFALAHWSVAAIAAGHLAPVDLRLRPNLALTAFAAGLTLLSSILFGLAPAFRITSADMSQNQPRARLGKALIAAQAALSLTLLVGAGLFLRTLQNLERVDLGFQRENVVLMDADASNSGYRGQRLRTFYDRLLEAARRVPNVRAAGLAGMTPMGGYAMSRTFSAEGYQPQRGERLLAYANPVSDGYLAALGIPMLLGRDFEPRDEPAITPKDNLFAALGRMAGGGADPPANASRVVIISESLARHLFGGANAVGRHLSFDETYSAGAALEIVGVVKDVHHSGVRQADDIGSIYAPNWSNGAEGRWLAVRIAGPEAPAIAGIQRELRAIDPKVPLLGSDKLEDNVNADLRRERMIAYLCGCFGALALAMAAVGLYGVMAYAVAQRTREVGIRMALGAGRLDMIRMVVGEALLPVLGGIAIGIAAALAASRVVVSLLFGVAPRDPLSFGVAIGALLAVALGAAAIPARSASRVEPAIALRHE